VALHTTVGFSRTTDAGIAERAGVTRMTFYRHFPDGPSLLRACTTHGLQMMPPPDSRPWSRIPDPEARLRTGLNELYSYYAVAGPALATIARDTPLLRPEQRLAVQNVQLDHARGTLPADVRGQPLLEMVAPGHMEALLAIVYVLARGWPVRGRRRRVLLGTISHAVAVSTWQSLVQEQGLDETEAVELLVAMVRAAASEVS
jgi:AcrR family transcriptional regulator